MADFGLRLMTGIGGAVIASPPIVLVGGLVGFVYAKFSDLPPLQVAKATAIWNVAEASLQTIGASFTENEAAQKIIRATILTTGTILGPQLMKQRGLIGPKMAIFLIVIRTLGICELLIQAIYLSPSSTSNEEESD